MMHREPPAVRRPDVARRVGAARRVVLLFAVLATLGGSGCDSPEDAPRAGTSALSQEIGQWLARVGEAHRQLDRARDVGQMDEAKRQLEAILDEEPPATLAAEHWAEVRQDIAGRLSRLALERGELERARSWAERGLGFHEGPSVFRANLFVARANAERALGDADAASASLLEALKVNERLLEQELENP